MFTDSPRYSTMDLEDCEAFYHEEIAQKMRADGLDSDQETPTYAWLSDYYRGFIAHLSRNFDLSPGDFYAEIGVPPNDDEDDDSPFGFVDDQDTRQRSNPTCVSSGTGRGVPNRRSRPGAQSFAATSRPTSR